MKTIPQHLSLGIAPDDVPSEFPVNFPVPAILFNQRMDLLCGELAHS